MFSHIIQKVSEDISIDVAEHRYFFLREKLIF